MAVLANIRSLFSPKKALEESGDAGSSAALDPGKTVESSGASTSSVLIDAEPPPSNVVNIYSHGFTNGVFRVEPDEAGFEKFLEHCNQSDKIREAQALNKMAISELESLLNAQREADAMDNGTMVEKSSMAEHLTASVDEMTGVKKTMELKAAELSNRQKETVAEYAWVPALLFLGAGITFIAADISITKQITSWGFNMSGTQGWIYAVGLAFTAFLIKPTIDRILEKPFQASGLKLKRLYKWVLLAVTVMGLVMLWCLGRFRADSERARTKLDGFTSQMSQTAPGSTEYKGLEAKYGDEERRLDENTMGQNGLVLSGLLFAIGGAICLSVAFGSLKQLINRYWILPIQISRAKRGTKSTGRRLEGLRLEYTLVKAEVEKAEKRLAASEVKVLQTNLEKLRTEELALVSAFYASQFERERALYRDGRSRGEKYRVDGELLYKTVSSDNAPLYVGKQSGSQGDQSSRRYTRRPFVKMRKMIADQFNKNQNDQSHDGTDFEIAAQ